MYVEPGPHHTDKCHCQVCRLIIGAAEDYYNQGNESIKYTTRIVLDWEWQKKAAAAPSLTVSPLPIKKFVPARGQILQGLDFPKSEQYERLTAQGVPVPDWLPIEPGISLDPNVWGPYVVIKPDISRKAAEIKIKRTGRVRYKPPQANYDDHPVRLDHGLCRRIHHGFGVICGA